MNPDQWLANTALGLGATRAAILDTSLISFEESFRQLCEMNTCGHYGANWMCPPAVGGFEEMRSQVLGFERCLVVQTVVSLEDSFDFEGMTKAAGRHDQVFRQVLTHFRERFPGRKHFPLGAGACRYCPVCTCPAAPCAHPEEAIASLEAAGIDVNALVTACGMPYNNGPATVSYVGALLLL
jgi:predicted metal-binding protein